MNERSLIMEKDAIMNEQGGARNRGRLIVGLLIVLGLTAVIWTYLRSRNETPASAKSAATDATPTPSVPEIVDVTTAAAIVRRLPRSLEVVGSLAADEEVIIGAQVAGELSQLNVDFGGYVTAGQVIAQIDQRDAKLKVEQAEAALKQTMARLGMKEGERFDPQQNADVRVAKASLDWAKMDLDRASRLIENGDIARSIYDQSQVNHNLAQARYQAALDAVNQQLAIVEQQKSALSLARKAITDTVVRSPINGAVKEKFAARGSYLAVGGRIVSLVKINPLRLRADVPEYAAASAKAGQSMTLKVEAFPNQTFSGRVVRLGASLNEQTRALTIEAEVSNPRNQLRPGMFAKSELVTAKEAPILMVPQKAIIAAAGLNKVFVVENGKAVERIVKTGVVDGDLIEIVEGVREGEIVATSNADKLQQGSSVKTSN